MKIKVIRGKWGQRKWSRGRLWANKSLSSYLFSIHRFLPDIQRSINCFFTVSYILYLPMKGSASAFTEYDVVHGWPLLYILNLVL